MPTKHIPDTTWRKVEREFVKAVTETKAGLKDTQVLNYLILKGIENTKPEDYKELIKKD